MDMDMDIKFTSKTDKYYIHFDNSETCQKFIEIYQNTNTDNNNKNRIGNRCCQNKGCHLPDVTSWTQIHQLKNEFLSS